MDGCASAARSDLARLLRRSLPPSRLAALWRQRPAISNARALRAASCKRANDPDISLLNAFLFQAAEDDCVAIGEKLLAKGASVKARRMQGETALHHAAKAGSADFAAMLIARGAPVDERDLKGATPLFLAIEANRRKVVKLLLEKGAQPDTPGRSDVRPLAAAAYTGADSLVDLLIAKKADINAVDRSGKAAIVYAAARGFTGIVESLLKAGADVNRRYGNDLTALMWAAGYSNDVPEAEGFDTVNLLIAHGARLDDTDNRGRTALMTAAELGHAAWSHAPQGGRQRRSARQRGQDRARPRHRRCREAGPGQALSAPV